jgi:hypothetical protein
MELIKYYPQNKFPNIDQYRDKLINRYYGNATRVIPAVDAPEQKVFDLPDDATMDAAAAAAAATTTTTATSTSSK